MLLLKAFSNPYNILNIGRSTLLFGRIGNDLEAELEVSLLGIVEFDKVLFSETVKVKRLESVRSRGLTGGPYSNIIINVGYALSSELPRVRSQFLDFGY